MQYANGEGTICEISSWDETPWGKTEGICVINFVLTVCVSVFTTGPFSAINILSCVERLFPTHVQGWHSLHLA